MKRFALLIAFLAFCVINLDAQGFLRASGKKIVDGSNNEVILRGIGTGNWLLMEGYMMKSSDVAGTHTGFRKKLEQTIGVDQTAVFYEQWLDNHFTRTDVDSMKAWGFNSIRVAMHYKWMTLPIEDEPVAGQDTWFEEGFARLDTLLDWCEANQMYLILDLHAAPGGQGKDANISDYDPTKPSLWESAENRRKTVALWRRLAERYANEPWIGGYDLINEPNWDLPNGTLLRQLYGQITTAIREVDTNHMIIIEGNWFANDYTGLTPPWDNNMVYSFHKYWTYNTQNDLSWVINMRNNLNVPIWLGESGENSNSWFTDLIRLCEVNKIGWSWWPVKKAGINNVLQVSESQSYNNLISYWKSGYPAMTPEQAFAAVMEWADNHKIENCEVKRDVIDAMIRQPFTTETLPFAFNKPTVAVPAVNYDLGRSSFAYKDSDSANYHLNTNSYTNWNQGWAYRNDGVDIGESNDTFFGANGYYVGWTENNEWLQYTLHSDSAAAYKLVIRSASANSKPGVIRFSVNGINITPAISLPHTGGWQTWRTTELNDVILPAGENKVRIYFERGGSNLGLFNFTNPVDPASVSFGYISAETNSDGDQILVTVNKTVTALSAAVADFQVKSGDDVLLLSGIEAHPDNAFQFIVKLTEAIEYGQTVTISYTGNTIMHVDQPLLSFENQQVTNNLPKRFSLPSKIEAEDYFFNNGFQFEDCNDVGGGKNLGFANNGDYIDYLIKVPEAGEYQILFRIASIYSNGRISIRVSGAGQSFQTIGTHNVAATGGWQTWVNQTIRVNLPAGNITLRLYSFAGEYNINWFDISKPTAIPETGGKGKLKIFPNPGNGIFRINNTERIDGSANIKVFNAYGEEVEDILLNISAGNHFELDLTRFSPGIYFLQLNSEKGIYSTKVLIQ